MTVVAMRGHLDSLTASGYLEGWAFDPRQIEKSLAVSVRVGEREVARGLAHLFRKDLMESGCGTGWCAFRLKVEADREQLPGQSLQLVAASGGEVIHVNPSISCVNDAPRPMDSIEQICLEDPTLVAGVWQLRGCEKLLMAHIRKHGLEYFVRKAYIYILGRPADDEGLRRYTTAIRQAQLTPVGVLEVLADSEEYRSCGKQMAAPNALGFPFI